MDWLYEEHSLMKQLVFCLLIGAGFSAVLAEETKTSTVTLGNPDLTDGIPGDGPLTIDQIKK